MNRKDIIIMVLLIIMVCGAGLLVGYYEKRENMIYGVGLVRGILAETKNNVFYGGDLTAKEMFLLDLETSIFDTSECIKIFFDEDE